MELKLNWHRATSGGAKTKPIPKKLNFNSPQLPLNLFERLIEASGQITGTYTTRQRRENHKGALAFFLSGCF